MNLFQIEIVHIGLHDTNPILDYDENVNFYSIGQNNQKITKTNDFRFFFGQIVKLGKSHREFKLKQYVVGYIPINHPNSVDLKTGTIDIEDFYIVTVPENIKSKEASLVPYNALKAYVAVHLKGKLLEGEIVLINNIATGYGILAYQLATLIGARPLIYLKNKEELNFLKSYKDIPEENILNASKEDFIDQLKAKTNNLGCNVVLDFDLSHTTEQKRKMIECLSPGGRWIVADGKIQLDNPEIKCLFLKNTSVNFLFEDSYGIYGLELGKVLVIYKDCLDKIGLGKFQLNVEKEFNSVEEYEIYIAKGTGNSNSLFIVNLMEVA